MNQDGKRSTKEHGGMFGLGAPNVDYAKYFDGNSYIGTRETNPICPVIEKSQSFCIVVLARR